MIPLRPDDEIPDRPLECGACKKQIVIRYTEILGNQTTHYSMCGDCPVCHRKLYGKTQAAGSAIQSEKGAELACGECHTTLEAIKLGNPLGCSTCYDVFGDTLLISMIESKQVSKRLSAKNRRGIYHIGRVQGESLEINPSMKLIALNEALKEMLNREDYEQAALLRDQIKELTEEQRKEDEQKDRKGKDISSN